MIGLKLKNHHQANPQKHSGISDTAQRELGVNCHQLFLGGDSTVSLMNWQKPMLEHITQSSLVRWRQALMGHSQNREDFLRQGMTIKKPELAAAQAEAEDKANAGELTR